MSIRRRILVDFCQMGRPPVHKKKKQTNKQNKKQNPGVLKARILSAPHITGVAIALKTWLSVHILSATTKMVNSMCIC